MSHYLLESVQQFLPSVATRDRTKGVKSHISRIHGKVPRERTETTFCRVSGLVYVITCANFGIEKLITALNFTRVQVLVFPIETTIFNDIGLLRTYLVTLIMQL